MSEFKKYFDDNEFEQAVEYYEKILEFDSLGYFDKNNKEKLYCFYGWCRFMLLQGKATEAINIFNKNIPEITDPLFSASSFQRQLIGLYDQRANLSFYIGDYRNGLKIINSVISSKKSYNVRAKTLGEKKFRFHQSNIIKGKLLWKNGQLFEDLAAYFKSFRYKGDEENAFALDNRTKIKNKLFCKKDEQDKVWRVICIYEEECDLRSITFGAYPTIVIARNRQVKANLLLYYKTKSIVNLE